MAIYQINNDEITAIKETTFSERGLQERADLQRLLKKQVEIISPNTLVIAEEFGEWEESRRRIDLLGIDKAANVVVIELKRTEDGGHMDLQAIRYAAMVSTLTFDKVIEIFQKYIELNDLDLSARKTLLEHLGWDEPDDDQFAQDVNIVLASAEFSKELTTAVMWLNQRELTIRCVRLKPYVDGERTLLDVQTVIPLPEAESYQIQIREKQQKERQSRNTNRDMTRYDVTVNGNTEHNLPKRWVMYHVIKPIIESGVHPEQIAKLIKPQKYNLFQCFDELVDEEQVVEKLASDDNGVSTPRHKRFFFKESELFHIDGKTYVLTNQWGTTTLEAAKILTDEYPELYISVIPTN